MELFYGITRINWLKIMRISCTQLLFLFLFCGMSYARTGKAQINLHQRVTITERYVKISNLLNRLEKAANIKFVYSLNVVDVTHKAYVAAGNRPLDSILNEVLLNNGIRYDVIYDRIVLYPLPKNKDNREPADNAAAAAGVSLKAVDVRGKVTDEDDKPIPGVTVQVKNTNIGTVTDGKGLYVVHPLTEHDTLVFSFIGFTRQEIPVDGRHTIDVKLLASSSGLNEVMVVGYGTQRKVDLTGSIASVSSEKLEGRPLVNLGDGLEGLIPNLNVNLQNGQPGTGATYNIRGLTTINKSSSSAPLILVDGVQRDPNLIDPNDVESVTVLKDAASAAIYGGRAAYGVILITTKMAKKGRMQVTYSGAYTTSRPTNLPKYVDSDGYLKLFNTAQRTGSLSGGYTSTSPFTEQDSIMAAAYRKDPQNNPNAYPDPGNPKLYRYVGNTNWIDVLYPGWAPQQEHHLSVSGGEGKTNYAASLGYFSQDGLEKVAKQVYKRITPNLKINSDITPWLTMNLSMSMTHTENNSGAITRVNQGGAWIPTDLRPLMPVYNPDGNFSGQGSFTNPVAVLTNSGRDINIINDFWTTGRVIIKPVDHLTITSDYTWNNYSASDKANLIPYNEYGVDGVFLDIFPWTNPSQVSENKQNNNYNALNIYATYENTFAKKHYFKAMVGYNQEAQHYVLSTALAHNLIDPSLPAIGVNNDTKPSVGGTETSSALIGTFFRLNYNYNQKYLLEVNGRYDGTSRFQPSSRYAFSPSFSAGWNIAEESFMQGLKRTVNELKLRASYGELPNQLAPTDVITSATQYPYIATMPTSAVNYLFNSIPGVTVGTPGLISPTFTWEKVQTKNFGLDYALLNEKLSGSFDYFITDTKDMVVSSQQLPAVLGTTAPPTNSADLRTKGWEFSLSWNDRLFDKKLQYSITLGLSDNTSTITRYSGNPTYSLSDYYPGEKLGAIWGYTTEGFYKTDQEAAAVDNSYLAGYTWLAGDIKYADLNHDGKINNGANTLPSHGDMKVLGYNTPRYKIGFNLGLSYKGFDFTGFIQGVLKNDFSPTGNSVFNAFPNDEWGIPYGYAIDYWTPENPNAYFPRPRFAGGGNNQAQTKYLQSAAYARVKQLTLGYSLPKELISRINIQGVRVYVTGANLITFTSLFKGFDPEIVNFGGNFNTYPINKSVSFGLRVTL